MNEHYPVEPCPFCNIAAAYAYPGDALWASKKDELSKSVPGEKEVKEDSTTPSSFVVLRSKGVLAFLDIAPMVGGEFGLSF
jgi:hypothetical protein